jgi:hypothetical protein
MIRDDFNVRLIRRFGVCSRTALIAALALGLVSCGSAAPPSSPGPTVAAPNGGLTQINEGGQVTIEVTWHGPSAGLVFDVAMDTHSVDLDGYDLAQLALLRTDEGVEVKPGGWDAPPGGHHRSGALMFPDKAPDGRSVIGPTTKSIELVIHEVAGVPERVFRWTP